MLKNFQNWEKDHPIYENPAGQFSALWTFFTGKKLPVLLRGDRELGEDEMPSQARPLTPLVGFALGLCLVVPLFVIGIFGLIPKVIAAGILAPVFLEYLTDWKGIPSLAAYIEARRNGAGQDEALSDQVPEGFIHQDSVSPVILLFIYVFRGAMFAALIYCGADFWLIAAMTGAYLIRAELTSVREGDTGLEYFPVDVKSKKADWYIGGTIVLIFSLGSLSHFLGGIAALGVCYGLSWYFCQLCISTRQGMTRKALDVFGCASELQLLFCGLLFYAGHMS